MTQFRYEHRGRREGRRVTRYGLPSGRDTGEFRKRSEASSQSPGRSSPKVSKEVDSSDETGGIGNREVSGGFGSGEGARRLREGPKTWGCRGPTLEWRLSGCTAVLRCFGTIVNHVIVSQVPGTARRHPDGFTTVNNRLARGYSLVPGVQYHDTTVVALDCLRFNVALSKWPRRKRGATSAQPWQVVADVHSSPGGPNQAGQI